MLFYSTLNIGIQGLNLLSKGVLLFLLTYYLPVEQLGLFGLLAGTLVLALFVVGLGFRGYSIREMLRCERDDVARLLRDQLVLHGLTYLVLLPAFLAFFVLGALPWALAPWFYGLLVFDHLNEESYRVQVTLSHTTRAAVLLLVRQGLWVYALLAVMALGIDRSLVGLLGAWLAGELAALLLGFYWLRQLRWDAVRAAPVDWPWLGRGLRTAFPLVGATLAFSAVTLAPRYALEAFRGPEQVGVYTFYSYVSNAIQSLLDVGVVNALQPRIVQAYQEGRLVDYSRLMRRLLVSSLGINLGLCAVAGLLIRLVVGLLDRPAYGRHLDTFALVLVQSFALTLVSVPLTALYARHADRQRLAVCLLGLLVAVPLNACLVPAFGLNGAATATLITFLVVAVAGLCLLRFGR